MHFISVVAMLDPQIFQANWIDRQLFTPPANFLQMSFSDRATTTGRKHIFCFNSRLETEDSRILNGILAVHLVTVTVTVMLMAMALVVMLVMVAVYLLSPNHIALQLLQVKLQHQHQIQQLQ